MKRLLIFGLVILGSVLLLVAAWPSKQSSQPKDSTTEIQTRAAETKTSTHNHEPTQRVPAHFNVAPPLNSLRATLAPEIFSGNVREAYQVAKRIPQTLAQLPCYCHCDMNAGHKSLHSCFEDEHGANCGICIGEALMASSLEQQGFTAAEIRQHIIDAYGPQRNQSLAQ
jgi:hypothetical protein